MFNLAVRFAQTASNITYYVAERTVQASCSLLVAASHVADCAQSLLPAYTHEFWTIGQGALMSACGVATIAKATRSSGPRKLRYPVVAGGLCMVGIGIYTIIDNVGRLCGGTDVQPSHRRRFVPLDVPKTNSKALREPICFRRDAPEPFQQICQIDGHKSTLIMCHVANGGGDISHCKMTFDFLADSFLEHQVDIGVAADVRPDFEKLFSENFSKNTVYFPNYSKITTRKDDLVVDCPILVYKSEIRSVLGTIANNTTPHLGVTEFDYSPTVLAINQVMKKLNHTQSKFFSSGLGADSIGIPFNQARYKAAAAAGFDELSRLKKLSTLSSPGLQQAILGHAYSQEAIADFHKKYSLYPSYTHKGGSKDAFFTTILKVHSLLNETRSPCFVFVGSALSPMRTNLDIPTHERKIFRDMQLLGFNYIDHLFSSVPKPDTFLLNQVNFSRNMEALRTVRIVSTPYTPHQNLVTLWAAGRIGQGTGDMSAAEIFEAHLPFMYELVHHKTPFANAVAERAKLFDPELGKIMEDLMTLFGEHATDPRWELHTMRKYGTIEEAWPDESTTKAAHALKRLLEKLPVWHRFIQHLFKHHNEFTKIHEVVKEYLR